MGSRFCAQLQQREREREREVREREEETWGMQGKERKGRKESRVHKVLVFFCRTEICKEIIIIKDKVQHLKCMLGNAGWEYHFVWRAQGKLPERRVG